MNLAGHSSQQGGQVARVLPKVGSGGTIFSGPISAFSAASVSTEVARLSPSSSIEWENPSPVAIRKNTPNRRESFRFWSPEGMRQPACASLSTRRRSVRRPRPEFLGVAYGPDVLDPVACDLDGAHRHGDAVLLSDQAGLAVDGPFEERPVAGCPAGDFDPGARDLLAAFDGAQECSGEAAAVGDRRSVGIEQADQGVDVLGFPGLLEGPDDAGLVACPVRATLRAPHSPAA